ncbi:MAG: triose-phosphate isomerase [Myxococcota bacterium]
MTERRPVIAGNWKLNKTVDEALALVGGLREAVDAASDVDVIVAPVATALHPVCTALRGSRLGVAGQNTHEQNAGAFTGELSPALLNDVGCQFCIVGHSERRTLFGETDAGVHSKAGALLEAGLSPIVCVGEQLAEREAGKTLEVVLGQVDAALEGLNLENVILAYEPVWAIGTGRTASPADAQEVHAAIRARITETHGPVAQGLRILYGGSVKPANAADLLAQPDIDGALVGGASLVAESFLAILKAAQNT